MTASYPILFQIFDLNEFADFETTSAASAFLRSFVVKKLKLSFKKFELVDPTSFFVK